MGVLAPFSLRLRDLCWFIVGIDIAHVYTYFGHIINMVSQILPKKHELADFGLKNKNRPILAETSQNMAEWLLMWSLPIMTIIYHE